MRGLIRRGMRLELVAGLGIALLMPAMALAAENAPGLATQTTLTVETRDQAGRTQAAVAVIVTGEDGLPAVGAVSIEDNGKPLAGVALNAEGQAGAVLSLPAGDHSLRAVYNGDESRQASASLATGVHALVSATPSFQVSVAPATLSLTPGQSGTVTATVTPSNAAALTAPMFVTLSCSGLPDQASCAFTPENVEILPTTIGAVTSSMVIGTQAASTASIVPRTASPIVWAFLLPGGLGLLGLAWGGRRRRWLNRVSLVALVGLVTMLGTTGCNPRYDYEHHGPPQNLPTPAGTYTVTVTAQSSNGITAITQNTSLALTVQ